MIEIEDDHDYLRYDDPDVPLPAAWLRPPTSREDAENRLGILFVREAVRRSRQKLKTRRSA